MTKEAEAKIVAEFEARLAEIDFFELGRQLGEALKAALLQTQLESKQK